MTYSVVNPSLMYYAKAFISNKVFKVAILKFQVELERIPLIDTPSVYIIIDLNRVQFDHLLK